MMGHGLEDVKQKYDTDNEFRMLVDMMMALIAKAQFTPSEIRQAAMYAAIRYEMYHSRPAIYHPQNSPGEL